MTHNNYIFTLYPICDCPIPYYYNPSFDYWYGEAVGILSLRSESDIAKILLDIDIYAANKHLSSYKSKEGEPGFTDLKHAIQDLSHQNIDKLFEWDLYPGRYQFISLIHLKSEGKEPCYISAVPGLTWEECFASILLGKITFAFDREHKLKGANFSLTQYGKFYYDLGEYLGMFAFDCQEIHSFLERLEGCESRGWDLPMKAISTEKSRKANDVKYEEPRKIKGKFYEWYDRNRSGYKSINEAALAYVANELNENDKKILGENPVRVLADALRQREKTK